MNETLKAIIGYATYMIRMGFEFRSTNSIWNMNAPTLIKLPLTFFSLGIDLILAFIGFMIIFLPIMIVIFIMQQANGTP